jgi:hypothetical protein
MAAAIAHFARRTTRRATGVHAVAAAVKHLARRTRRHRRHGATDDAIAVTVEHFAWRARLRRRPRDRRACAACVAEFASATWHLVRVAGFSVAADKTIVATLAVRHERVASRATRNQLDLFRTIGTVIRIDWLQATEAGARHIGSCAA